jgi:hypothetical protein
LGVAITAVAAILVGSVLVSATRGATRQPQVVQLHHMGRNLRVLLVGDSMAGTLGVGLAQAAPAAGVTLINAATEGCGVAIGWDGGWASSILIPGPPAYPCQSSGQLTGYWKALLDRYRPNTVIYVDRMDTIGQEVVPGSTGQMTSVLDPSFRGYLRRAMDQAVHVLASTGAHVILTTSVPTKIGLAGNQYDNPVRWDLYDGLVRDVAALSAGTVSVFDLGRFFGGAGPQPAFSLSDPSGTQWRCRDGLHFTPAAGVLAAPSLYGLAWAASPSPSSVPSGALAVPASVANKAWPPFEAQRIAMGCGA